MKPTKPNAKAARPAAPAARDARSPYADESLLDACGATPRLRLFLSVIDRAGLGGLLTGKGPLTIFAPTDRAFEKIPGDELDALLNDRQRLGQVLRHHMVSGRVKAPRELEPRSVNPQFGDALQLTSTAGNYHVDEARIVKTNLRAANGVIHAIDTVLMPRS